MTEAKRPDWRPIYRSCRRPRTVVNSDDGTRDGGGCCGLCIQAGSQAILPNTGKSQLSPEPLRIQSREFGRNDWHDFAGYVQISKVELGEFLD